MGGVLGHVLRDGAPRPGQVPLPALGAGARLVLRAVAHRAYPRLPRLGPLQVGLDVMRVYFISYIFMACHVGKMQCACLRGLKGGKAGEKCRCLLYDN